MVNNHHTYDPWKTPPNLCSECHRDWIQWRFYVSPEVRRNEVATYLCDVGMSRNRQIETIKQQHELIELICRRDHQEGSQTK